VSAALTLRRYQKADEEAAIELWRRTWQAAYPELDFTARLDWWRKRWRSELVPSATIVLAESDGLLTGFVTVDQKAGYLDQIVVATEHQGRGIADALLAEARRLSPAGLDLHVNQDNARAIRFYQKHGFTVTGTDVNPRSGAPIYTMSWRPRAG
jgi:putative acetyltransferase